MATEVIEKWLKALIHNLKRRINKGELDPLFQLAIALQERAKVVIRMERGR
jgi:Trp operon repressor